MKLLLILLLLFIISCNTNSQKNVYKISETRLMYSNIINMSGAPTNTFPKTEHEFFPFVDKGAWHAHYLPTKEDNTVWGAFTGPLFIAEEYGVYLSKAFAILDIYTNESYIDLKYSTDHLLKYQVVYYKNTTLKI